MLRFKEPKDSHQISWTKHCKEKMKFYSLSEAMVRNVLLRPKRKEAGIVEGTKAQMRQAGSKKRPQEIWIMYQLLKNGALRMISAWRYPGVSKPKDPVPVPPDILEELEKSLVQ